ncbi:hypothetical protein BX666DRAFT_1978593 [Dichotomocladium elegans]|nr:hypothetical protein BX666DRAFT_1978593 [Dichotomocladium elegans]
MAMLAERQRKAQITSESYKANFLRSLVDQQHESDSAVCGFDSRLAWPDHVWRQRVEQEAANTDEHNKETTSAVAAAEEPEFSVCQQAPCHKHAKWQELKMQEFEQDRADLFHILARGVRLRNKLKTRIRQRREMIDEGWMSNATIVHTKDAVIK